MASEPKKLALLRIWQILQKHSDYDHPMTQEDIITHLRNDYGIEMERKAVGKTCPSFARRESTSARAAQAAT